MIRPMHRVLTLVALLLLPAPVPPVPAASPVLAPQVTVMPISADPFAAPVPGQHASEVEPAAVAHDNTIVSAFQVGRLRGGGSVAIGWAIWRAGRWQHGLLPGLTSIQHPPGPYRLVSDPGVAYDAAHHRWLIALLAVAGTGHHQRTSVLVRSSPDGLHWNAHAVALVSTTPDNDKDWIACDSTPRSPFYGRCYVTWDRAGRVDRLMMSTSRDGGATWSRPVEPAGAPAGLAGEPVVQTTGTVVVPAFGELKHGAAIITFASHDGGASWGPAVTVSRIRYHPPAARFRAAPLPSVALDGADRVYVAWADCRFEPHCSANDIVLSSSSDGHRWSAVMRVPVAAIGSGVDAFLPALGASTAAGGRQAQLALTYDAYARARCTRATCRLGVGVIVSNDGGATWSVPRQVAGPMQLAWLAVAGQSPMVGDYIATVFAAGAAWGIVAVARPPRGARLEEAIDAIRIAIPATQRAAAGRAVRML